MLLKHTVRQRVAEAAAVADVAVGHGGGWAQARELHRSAAVERSRAKRGRGSRAVSVGNGGRRGESRRVRVHF